MTELRTRVLARVEEERTLTRVQFARLRWLVLCGAGLVSLALFVLAGGIRQTDRPTILLVATSVGASAIAVAAFELAFRRGSSMLGRSTGILVGIAVVTPLALLAWRFGVSSIFEDMTRRWPERPGFRCLGLALATGVPLMAAMLYLWYGTAPAHPRLTGLALGAATGALVWVLVDFWCPVSHVPHLMLGHVLPLVVFSALGLAAGGLLAARRGADLDAIG